MRYFCTYFDEHYLPRALALFESLEQRGGEFQLWALCMDSGSYEAVAKLDHARLHPISLPEFLQDDPELREARKNRSSVEFYFTCSPSLPIFLFERFPEIDLLTYLDADLFFFEDPQPIFDEIADTSIAIIPHRFSKCALDREKYGRYNVGWISFRRDEKAFACLRWWREKCIEWCYVRVEENRFADQKYLDEWPNRFDNVREIQHKGANLAPWNLANYRITEANGRMWVDDQPLLFYHFSGVLQLRTWLYNTSLASWKVRTSSVVCRGIYQPYLEALTRQLFGGVREAPRAGWEPPKREGLFARLWRKARMLMKIGGGVLTRNHLIMLRGKVL